MAGGIFVSQGRNVLLLLAKTQAMAGKGG